MPSLSPFLPPSFFPSLRPLVCTLLFFSTVSVSMFLHLLLCFSLLCRLLSLFFALLPFSLNMLSLNPPLSLFHSLPLPLFLNSLPITLTSLSSFSFLTPPFPYSRSHICQHYNFNSEISVFSISL